MDCKRCGRKISGRFGELCHSCREEVLYEKAEKITMYDYEEQYTGYPLYCMGEWFNSVEEYLDMLIEQAECVEEIESQSEYMWGAKIVDDSNLYLTDEIMYRKGNLYEKSDSIAVLIDKSLVDKYIQVWKDEYECE